MGLRRVAPGNVIACLFTAAAAFVCGVTAFGNSAQASIVTATLTGTVLGTDSGTNGQGVFGPASPTNSPLSGSFTLVFTFDDTLGQQSSGPSGVPPYYSSIQGTGAASPGTAVLTIGGVSVSFPGPGSSVASNSSSAYRSVSSAQTVTFAVQGSSTTIVDSVQASLMPDQGTVFTTDYNWESSFSYTYSGSGGGNSGFNYTLYRPDGSEAMATGILTVQSITVVGPPVLSPPVAVNETATTPANTPITIDLTQGATGGAATSAALVGAPTGGTVSISGTTATFTPTTGFTGAASFQFDLMNGSGTSNTAMANITVLPPPPVAANQSATTTAGVPVAINLSANATGGAPTSAAIVGTLTGGTVSLSGFTATFTPTASCTAANPCSFQFDLINAGGTSNTATATITVTGSCPLPQAQAANALPKMNSLTASTTSGQPAILFNGTDITTNSNAPQTVVVGQQINLEAQLPCGDTFQRWNITGGPILGYTPTTCNPKKGEILKLNDKDKTQNPITYYWTNATTGGTNYTVTMNYTLSDGTQGTPLQASFSVAPAPSLSLQAVYGIPGPDWIYIPKPPSSPPPPPPSCAPSSPTVFNGLTYMGFGNINDNNVGITFNVSGDPKNGTSLLVQLIDTDTIDYTPIIGTHVRCTSIPGLDAKFPYQFGKGNTDSPAYVLNGNKNLVRLFTAHMYLMWQLNSSSVPNPNIPVPLGYITWGFSESAELDRLVPHSVWSLSQVTKTPLPPNGLFTPDTKDYPLWKNLATLSPPCKLASD